MRGGLGLSAGIALLFLASVLTGSLVQAGTGPEAEAERGWTTYRGDPGRTGVRGTTGSDLGEPSWTFDVGPIAGSGPIIVDGILYIGGSAYPEGTWTERTADSCPENATDPCIAIVTEEGVPHYRAPVYAIDAGSGEVVWRQDLPARGVGSRGKVVSTPSYADGRLFVGSTTGILFALDASTGDVLWRAETQTRADVGIGTSPAVEDGRVFVGTTAGSSVAMAFDAATGERLWSHNETGMTSWSSPTVSGDTVYVGAITATRGGVAKLFALDVETGQERWSFEHQGWGHSTPLLFSGLVIFGSGDSHVYAVDAETGAFEWATEGHLPNIHNDGINGPPASDGERVFVGTGDHEVIALDPETGDILWRYKTDGPVSAGPVVDNGFVYAGSWDDHLHVLNGTTGELAWSYDTGRDIDDTAPAVVDGRVFVVNDAGTLAALHRGAQGVETATTIPGAHPFVISVALAALACLCTRRG